MEKIGVAIIGMGTVGTGVAKILLDHGDRTTRHAGKNLWLTHAVVRDLKKDRGFKVPDGVLIDDIETVINAEDVQVVVQLIGGIEPARTVMLQLLEAGKDVVTANKALLAEHGPELFEKAQQLGRSIAFEASVAGGIPIITNISQCLSANQITSLNGILNGTSNYIITRMDLEGTAYDDAVAEAQALGFAEADPAFDVDGTDAAQKLAILAHLAFGAQVHWSEIPKRGIDQLNDLDLKYAKHLGYRIKLIGLSRHTPEGLQAVVGPMLVKVGTPLAETRANYNAVSVDGDAVGPVFYHGQGAGQMPTASAVVADLIDTAVGRTAITFKTLKLWSDESNRIEMAKPGNLAGRFYLRFNVDDVPNVMAQIAGALGRHNISIASVYQHDDDIKEGVVPVVFVTKETTEADADSAISEIEKLDCVQANSERLRILE